MSKTGSCLCGDVSFTYKSEPGMFLMCHCTDCQKSTGSPVASIIIVPEDDFSINGSTSSYECEAKVTRSFCKICGSQIYSRIESAPGVVAIKTGVLDEQPNIKPNLVCWTKSKPNWFEINHPEITFEENPN
tara:strand:+ start:30 stop:422 length:393 start_codon:yes stop_codon:yes gene_type:complete